MVENVQLLKVVRLFYSERIKERLLSIYTRNDSAQELKG